MDSGTARRAMAPRTTRNGESMTSQSSVSLCLALAATAALHACAPLDGDVENAAPGTSTDAVAACGPAQPARGAVASVEQDGNPAANAIDGDLATRWSGNGVGATLTLDLGAARTICGVSVAWYNGAARRNHFVLALSSDGATFAPARAGDSSGTTANPESYSVAPTSARYVRLTVNGNTQNDWASVSEIAVAGQNGFVHPGVLVSRAQLDVVRARIAAGAEPWTSALDRARTSRYGSRSYTPHPVPEVQWGTGGVPNVGGDAETDDAIAAFTQTLLYYHTGDAAYAAKAVEILNAWSATLTARTGANVPLRTAWSAEVFTRAAEILRYAYPGWARADVDRFASMLVRLYLPLIRAGWWGGNNWQTSMTEATMNIAVFTDDRATFDHAVAMWRAGTPAYVYLASDGALPVRPIVGTFTDAQLRANWSDPTRFVDGLTMETCRDLGHTAMGLAAVFNAAETARIQGVDLYAEQQHRLTTALEFTTTYVNGAAVPSWLCGGTLDVGGTASALTFEVAHNAYANRAGVPLPNTRRAVLAHRPTNAGLHMVWETLTHGDVDAPAAR
jgi:hypothetical protein